MIITSHLGFITKKCQNLITLTKGMCIQDFSPIPVKIHFPLYDSFDKDIFWMLLRNSSAVLSAT